MKIVLRRAGLSAVVAVLAATAVGCGGGGREYAVPKSVCGMPVGESAVAPLLPDGEQLRQTGETPPARRAECKVSVDDTAALFLTFTGTDEKPADPMSQDVSYQFTHRKKLAGLPFPGEGALGDKSALVTTPCGGKGPANLIIEVSVDEGVTEDVSQRRADIQKFTTEYTKAARQKLSCA